MQGLICDEYRVKGKCNIPKCALLHIDMNPSIMNIVDQSKVIRGER